MESAEFEEIVGEFFARPQQSARVWERADDAQRRIIETVSRFNSLDTAGRNIAVVSHGGVGTLLFCYLKRIPISRREEQPKLGSYFIFDSNMMFVVQGWAVY